MRPLALLRLVLMVAVLAALPAVGAIVAYADAPTSTTVQPISLVSPTPNERSLLTDRYINGPAPMAGQNVVTTEGERIGEVAAVTETASGHVKEMLFKTGGFWGIGARTVAVPAGRFTVNGQDVFINLTHKELQHLPTVQTP